MDYSQTPEEFENEFFQEMKEQWRKTLPRFTDVELLAIFGDAIETMSDKIAELKEYRKAYVRKIYEMGKKYVRGEDIDSYFARLCIEHFLIKELQKVEKNLFLIQRLKRLKKHPKSKKQKGITAEDIENARNVSLVHLAEQHIGQLRMSGKNYVAKCVFHKDRTPSFYVYPESNRFHCFGCGVSGDVIAFIEKAMELDFKNAIYYLIQK